MGHRGIRPQPRGYDGHMAVTTTPKLDAHKLRADFPVFEQPIHGKPLAFLDSAVTSQKPRQVLDAMRDFYATSYSNVHRGVYTLSERATEGYEGAREKVRAFLNAPSTPRGDLHPPGDRGAQPRRLRLGPRQPRPGRPRSRHRARAPLELRALAADRAPYRRRLPDAADRRPRRAADGPARRGRRRRAGQGRRRQPRLELARHDQPDRAPRRLGARARARSWSSTRRRRRRTAGSTCRRSAPTSSRSRRTRCAARPGPGCSGAARELLEAMSPFNYGGSMIRSVKVEETLWNELPYKFEAGTPRDRGGLRARRRDRLPGGGRARGDRAARARARRVRARAAGRAAVRDRLRAAGRTGASGSSRSTSRASTRTTSPRCSTGRASRSAPATTAASR